MHKLLLLLLLLHIHHIRHLCAAVVLLQQLCICCSCRQRRFGRIGSAFSSTNWQFLLLQQAARWQIVFMLLRKLQKNKIKNKIQYKSVFIYLKLFCISLYFFFFVLNDTWSVVVVAVAVVVISFSAILAVATNCNCSSRHSLSPQPLDNPCSTASTRILCYVLHDNKNVCQMARTTFTQQCRQEGGPSPAAPFPFYGFRFGWVRFGSVQFSSVCWLFGFGAALVVLAFVAIVVVATGSDLALFALQSSPPTQRQLLLATCCCCCFFFYVQWKYACFQLRRSKASQTVTTTAMEQ